MRKFMLLLLAFALVLSLTACGDKGLAGTAHAEEAEETEEDWSDEYPDADEGLEWDEDYDGDWGADYIDPDYNPTSPPTAPTDPPKPTNPPSNTPANDGWDGQPENPPVEEALDQSEIPEGLRDGLISYAHTTVGTIVIHETGYVFRLINGEIEQVWDYSAKPGDIIIDASEYYEYARDRWYAYIGNSLVHFTEDEMIVDVRSCAEFEWSGMYMYCYHIEVGTLYSSSPCNDSAILNNVIEIYTKEGHTFARCLDGGVYVMNASPWAIGRQTQFYCNEHPVQWVYLGTGDWYDYYMQLDSRVTGKPALESAVDFDVKYGLDLDGWGNPIEEFNPSDVVLTADRDYQGVYDLYGVATYRTDVEIRLSGISYADLGGDLIYYFNPDGSPKRVYWECSSVSDEDLETIIDFTRAYGSEVTAIDTGDGKTTEYVYTVDGGYTLHVCYRNDKTDPSNSRIFIYADY